MIKVRGWQISPAELEAQLAIHPDIVEAGVVGVVSVEGDTELPRAYVVKVPGKELTEADIKEYMADNLAKFKALDGGVKFIDAIPRNSTGKVMRHALRQSAATQDEALHNPTQTSMPVGSKSAAKTALSSLPSIASRTDLKISSHVSQDSSGSEADDEEDASLTTPDYAGAEAFTFKHILGADIDTTEHGDVQTVDDDGTPSSVTRLQ